MDKLVPSFKQSLFDSNLGEIGIDMVEVGIDTLIADGVFSEIPIVKTIIGLGKFVQNIHDRNLLQQTLTFIQSFNTNTNPEKVNKYKNTLEKDPKRAEHELGRVLIILNRYIDKRKSFYLSKLFLSYVNEVVDWSEFSEFSEMLSMMLDSDISTLQETYQSKGIYDVRIISRKHDRLLNIGLMKNVTRQSGDTYLMPIGVENPLLMDLSEIGYKFCNIIFAI
jgi:hypothetical protein